MKRRKGTWLMRLGILLMLAAAVLAGRNLLEQYQAGQASLEVLAQMRQIMAENAPAAEEPSVQTNTGEIPEMPSAPQEEPLFVRFPNMEMPVSRIGRHDYIGVLDIPSMGLSLPVMTDWDYEKLRVSPCRYSGSVYSGDLIIAGHNYETHFRYIKDLAIGSEVRFTDMDGNVFFFEVSAVETIGPDNVGAMLAGDWDLTMFTCTIGGQMRSTVRCRLTGYTAAQGTN